MVNIKTGHGFVLIELVVVFAMIAALIGLTYTNVFSSGRKATLAGTIETLVTDIRSQQTKAMSSVPVGGAVPVGYGIHFEPTMYSLFSGLTYNPSDPANAVISIDPRETFITISLPDNNIVFAAQSGIFTGYSPTQRSIVLYHMDSGEMKTIEVNQYGVITAMQ
jgi:type II secretory pathway pseudopilin PulG